MDDDDDFGWFVDTVEGRSPIFFPFFPLPDDAFLFGAWATGEFLGKRGDPKANGWRRGGEFFSDACKTFEVKNAVGYIRRVCQDRIG